MKKRIIGEQESNIEDFSVDKAQAKPWKSQEEEQDKRWKIRKKGQCMDPAPI